MAITQINGAQNQIKRTLSQPESMERVRAILEANGDLNRTRLANKVCEEFGFYDPRGQAQQAGCIKALRTLERQGAFVLPPTQGKGNPHKPKGLGEPVPSPVNVPEAVEDIQDLELILVESEEHLRIWNELMLREHPLGGDVLVGRQLRYLVRSEHGWLGGLGFASSALHLRARDRWIGWDAETKEVYRERVGCLSRFLIRNEVHCHNLASSVLGMCLRELPGDFMRGITMTLGCWRPL